MNKTWSRRRSIAVMTTAVFGGGVLAACANGDDGGGGLAGGANGDDSVCEDFPAQTIDFVVPYSAGGGFDAWARFLEPYLEEQLGDGADVQVVNVAGGGGMRGMNQVYAADPDGYEIILTEPNFSTTNQILGETPEGYDTRGFTWLGYVTVDPNVFSVAPDSPVESITEFEGETVVHGGQDQSAVETVTYATFGISSELVLHEGTSDVFLSIRRGDADITVMSLSTTVEYIQADQAKPLLYIGSEEINEETQGYEFLTDVETIDDLGHPELAEPLEQVRAIAGPPDIPECLVEIYDDAIQAAIADEGFIDDVEGAGLRVIPGTAGETQERVEGLFDAYNEYDDLLQETTE